MLNKLLYHKKGWPPTVIHLVIGIISSGFPIIIIGWFLFVLFTSVTSLKFGSTYNNKINYIYLVTYLSSMESIIRMSGAFPILPYETGKYVLFFGFIIGIFTGMNKGNIGWMLLVLLLPALFFDKSFEVTKGDLYFNLLGPIDICLGVIFFKGFKINKDDVFNVLKLFALPIIFCAGFALVKTPQDFGDVDFGLGANFMTSGRSGSNQVSTVFGLGVFVLFIFQIKGRTFTNSRIIDFIILLLFGFQAFLTFSRGGVFGAALAILLLIIYEYFFLDKTEGKLLSNRLASSLMPLLFIGISFLIVDNISNGKLTLRYLGETEATMANTKEKDINSVTSGRFNIYEEDIMLWNDNFFLGTGVAASKNLRKESQYVLSHVEFSRLLAEHGLLGLIFIIIILLQIISINGQEGNYKGILMSIYLIAIYTTFHAATRTYISPLLLGISLITVNKSDEIN
jgi:hypothetical protein